MDFEKRELIDKFFDEQGIVVDFPGSIEDELLAAVRFAQDCLIDTEKAETDSQKAEADNARLRAALEAVEFVMDGGEPTGHMDYSCAWCRAPVDYSQIKDGTAHEAHKPDCLRQQALERKP